MGSSAGPQSESPSSRVGNEADRRPLVAVVGSCASGKSLLVEALREQGFNAHEVAQEHSYIPDLWRRIAGADLLVYLDVSLQEARERRPTDIGEQGWSALSQRLEKAREQADLLVDTDGMTPEDVLERVVAFLKGVSAGPEARSVEQV